MDVFICHCQAQVQPWEVKKHFCKSLTCSNCQSKLTPDEAHFHFLSGCTAAPAARPSSVPLNFEEPAVLTKGVSEPTVKPTEEERNHAAEQLRAIVEEQHVRQRQPRIVRTFEELESNEIREIPIDVPERRNSAADHTMSYCSLLHVFFLGLNSLVRDFATSPYQKHWHEVGNVVFNVTFLAIIFGCNYVKKEAFEESRNKTRRILNVMCVQGSQLSLVTTAAATCFPFLPSLYNVFMNTVFGVESMATSKPGFAHQFVPFFAYFVVALLLLGEILRREFHFTFTSDISANPAEFESDRICPSALIVEKLCVDGEHSHWQAVQSLSEWLRKADVPCLSGIDVRQLVKKIRETGSMKAKLVIESDNPQNFDYVDVNAENLVDFVSRKEPNVYGTEDQTILAVDLAMDSELTSRIIEWNEIHRIYGIFQMSSLQTLGSVFRQKFRFFLVLRKS
ncbi:hypothetical protein CAEBREN_00860 [Caenorhabditis brenneri]|uniref:Carbamoyl-phosphate synthase small subunit N-terminal domain-containing protein n=1 Tax=Caenorhabditis brenneri TaxID=135651 RepID=G0PFK7_CAEBE|nr:hypothetical protein CAEBREN_00860 [Caenorhabditis brenneri]